MKVNIAHIEPESYIYAPGKQFVVWMQGCSIRCKGCWNKGMWSFGEKKYVEIETVMVQINKTKGVKGVTFIGGEPFDQPEELLDFVKRIKRENLGVTIYTGYGKKELISNIAIEVLQFTDLLISGRYIETLRNVNLQWIGSENQRKDFLTNFYADYHFDNANYCEINISETGAMTIVGFPDENLLKR